MTDDNDFSHDQEGHEFAAESTSLWKITFGPLVWATHFILTYPGTAVFCAKFDKAGASFWLLRLGVGILTVLALATIISLGWRAWRQWDVVNDREWENESGNNEDRHQFLGHAAFLLAVISGIGVMYVGLPAVLFESCR